MEYSVKIDAFEGPLDLLLHLLNRYEIDIYDIPVSQITEQYLAYIHTMSVLKLDVASEYLVMAATLLAIKSKMLLPKPEEVLLDDEFEYDEEDPREQLVERLIEYRKYKQAAEDLKQRETDRSLVYTRPPISLNEYINDDEKKNPVTDVSIYDMLTAIQKLMNRKKVSTPRPTRIQRQEIPISERMDEILEELSLANRRISFNELFPIPEREHIVVTFLALLELMKKDLIQCQQDKNFDEIWILKV